MWCGSRRGRCAPPWWCSAEPIGQGAERRVAGAQEAPDTNRQFLPGVAALQRLDGVLRLAGVLVCLLAISSVLIHQELAVLVAVHVMWCGVPQQCAPHITRLRVVRDWYSCTGIAEIDCSATGPADRVPINKWHHKQKVAQGCHTRLAQGWGQMASTGTRSGRFGVVLIPNSGAVATSGVSVWRIAGIDCSAMDLSDAPQIHCSATDLSDLVHLHLWKTSFPQYTCSVTPVCVTSRHNQG